MPFDAVDPMWLAMSRFRRHRLDDTIAACSEVLSHQRLDSAAWLLKCKALTKKDYLDETELEEEGVGDILLDDNAVADVPRPGTSLKRPHSQAGTGGINQSLRPMTGMNRPVSGFRRPGSATGTAAGDAGDVGAAFRGDRVGTARPVTSLGREVRLGTASLDSAGEQFIEVERIDVTKFASRGALARALADYLLIREHNTRKALELSAAGTSANGLQDWWWKLRLGRCYYKLGLFREAERQLKSSLKDQEMVVTYLELYKVYVKIDQPNAALEWLEKGTRSFPGETRLHLAMAWVHDSLFDPDRAVVSYSDVLRLDPSNIEAIACTAAHYFYLDQPEVALRFYRRLLQMGLRTPELWCNLGLCCFYAGQYDMTIGAFNRALHLASDDEMGDIWYNVGQVSLSLGDTGTAQQAFKVAMSLDSNHAESLVNLGVLEQRKGNLAEARSLYATARDLAPHLWEPRYNGALLARKSGDYEEAYKLVQEALHLYPGHTDSQELVEGLMKQFKAL